MTSSSSSNRVDSRGPLRQPRVATTTSLGSFGTNAEGCTIADLLDPWMARASWPIIHVLTCKLYATVFYCFYVLWAIVSWLKCSWRQTSWRASRRLVPGRSWLLSVSDLESAKRSSTGLPASRKIGTSFWFPTSLAWTTTSKSVSVTPVAEVGDLRTNTTRLDYGSITSKLLCWQKAM